MKHEALLNNYYLLYFALCHVVIFVSMIQELQNEAASLDELYEQVQEIQASVRLAFINCFIDFAGRLSSVLQFLVLAVFLCK